MKKILKVLGVVIILSFLLTVCVPVAATAAAKIVLKLGHTVQDDSAYNKGAVYFKELVKKYSDDEMDVTVYGNSQLGWERDMLEGLQLGTIDMCISATGPLAAFVPKFDIFNFPFLFKNIDHILWFINEYPGLNEIKENALEQRFKILAVRGSSFRIPFGKKFFTKPSDFKGVTIRLMDVPMHRDTYIAFGADVTSTSFAELYSALQMGVVDAAENSYTAINAMKYSEVTSHITELPVLLGANALVMSLKTWDSLSKEQQETIQKAADEAWDYEDQITIEMDQESKQKLIKEGIKVQEDVNLTPFIDKLQPIYDKYASQSKYPEWIRQTISDIMSKANEF